MARRGKSNATIRIDPDLWRRFGEVADDRSSLLREFIAWYIRDRGAKLPVRPKDLDHHAAALPLHLPH